MKLIAHSDSGGFSRPRRRPMVILEAMTTYRKESAMSAMPAMSVTNDPQALADRYAALWNEPDPTARRRAIAALWAPDGAHYVAALEFRGHEALERRVLEAYDKNVRLGGNRFRAVRNAQ